MDLPRHISGLRLRRPFRALAGALLVLASTACQDLSVSAVPIDAIDVQPSSPTILVGETLEMSFVAVDESGNELSGRFVEWAVRDSDVARIGSNGVVTALGAGQTIVEARSEGVTGEATLEVLSAPAIGLDPDSVDFTAVEGESDPSPETVAIENIGAGSLTGLDIIVGYGEGEPTGWLNPRLTGRTAPADLILRADIGSLVDGTYTATVDVQSSVAGNSPQTVYVTLTVQEPPPEIVFNPTSWSTQAPRFFTETRRDSAAVGNGGGMALEGLAVDSIHYDQPNYAGWLEATLRATAAPTWLYLEAYAWLRPDEPNQALPPGTYTATVYVSAPGASNTPATFPVTFRITSTLEENDE